MIEIAVTIMRTINIKTRAGRGLHNRPKRPVAFFAILLLVSCHLPSNLRCG
jgi:hypothetical protein